MVATNLTLVAIVAGLVFAVFWFFGEMQTGPRARLVVVPPLAAEQTTAGVEEPGLPDAMPVGAIPDRPERE